MRRFRNGYAAAAFASLLVAACGWSPSRPFEREAPEVREAIRELDAGQPKSAEALLEEYLATGVCNEGRIGTPPRVREKASGSFDLGLALFGVGETFGGRFGDEDATDGGLGDPALKAKRAEAVECALPIVRAIAQDPAQPADLRARARFLEGNLLFLNGAYEEAVKAYDRALEIAPGMHASGPSGASDAGKPYEVDAIGRDAAWNRAIALRRIEDKKNDAGEDGGPPDGGDGGGGDGGDQPKDGGGGGDSGDPSKDGGDPSKDGGDPQKDGGDPRDAGEQKADETPKGQPQPQRQPDPPKTMSASQDERMLDHLENARTVQQEAVKKMRSRPVQGSVDK